MCCIKRSHDRGIADDKVRKLENIDNFWKQNTLCKRWNVGYMSVLEWCGSLGWNPSPVEHNGNFSFHCNKIKFSLAPRFKSMWRCSEISSLETNVVWFRHFHSFPALQSSPMSSRALSWSSFTTQVSHRRESTPPPPKSETALVHQTPNLHNLHWITIDALLPLVRSLFHWLWEHLYRLGKAWMKFLEVQQINHPLITILLSKFKSCWKE